MLEKIGLPPKPSLRGNNWVVDASHCQGCCSQFTMFNRKHHCRRCGGLFCNNCTQERMYLRGQGDSPVRICDPCKKLEEAARLEARHGYKSRAAKGSSKPATKPEDELDLILSTDGKRSLQSVEDMVSDVLAAGTSSQKFEATQGREFDISGSRSSSADDIGSGNPEDLRKRAQEEKRKYTILKREGKSDEALRAFKRGKELERQAASLELALRKKQKIPFSVLTPLSSDRANNQASSSGRKTKSVKQGKETDDLTSELKELGWSEADLHDADKKPEKMTLEGELINLLKEVPQKSSLRKETNDADKARIVALKRNALKLKREGRLAEAKEELKQAKILEKELEQKEFLGDDSDESDDEIAALIRCMDNDNHDNTETNFASDVNLNLSHIIDAGDGIAVDGDFDVTDDDMNDPEIVSALRSFGWEEEPDMPSSVNLEALRNEVLSLKREAVRLKREGNNAAAMEQLKKAKLLDEDLQHFQSEGTNSQTTTTNFRSSADTHEFSEDTKTTGSLVSTRSSKSKSEIQKELLGLKRKALALRREGRVDEAEEELKKCKALEIQLDEVENAKKMAPTIGKGSGFDDELHGISGNSVLPEEGMEEVSEQDMHDPALLSILNTLGWTDGDEPHVTGPLESSKRVNHAVVPDNGTSELEVKVRRNRAEIQKELLSVKRRSLALRRQGKLEEAEEELKKAKVLEDEMKEMDSSQMDLTVGVEDKVVKNPKQNDFGPLNVTKQHQQQEAGKIGEERSSFPALSSLSLKNGGSGDGTASAMDAKVQRTRAEIQKELLGIKRRSLALRHEGKLEEAEEELKKAKILEAQIEEIDSLKQSPVLDLNSGFDNELRHLAFGSSDLSKQKDGAGLPAEETSMGVDTRDAPEIVDVMKGTDLKKNNFAEHPVRKLETSVLVTSQNEPNMSKSIAGLHGSFDLLQEESLPALVLPQATKPSYISDLLTGEDLVVSHLTHRRANEALSTSNLEGGTSSAQLLQTSEPDATKEKANIKAGFSSGANLVDGVRDHEKTSGSFRTISEVDSHAKNTSVKNIADQVSPRQEILAHKRRAVALKKEGKLAEAKEELRHAKILEQGLEAGGDNKRGSSPASSDPGRKQQTQSLSSTQSVTLPHDSASSDTSISPESKHQGQAQKPVSGRDRFKLQQECLAHKRQALRLRREGRMEESEREFELAKALESQLEEAPNNQTPAVSAEATDDLSVEDLLDPQLLSALQAIGIPGLGLPTPAPQVHEAKGNIPRQQVSSSVGSSKHASQERSQLEEQIKAEKVQALHLKRAGKPAEAMDALRRAKLLEKKLNSLCS
ncbi:Vacuolar sorting-associated protein 27 [Nymphaea thermarum]|nr:Vacuolar sorting-associated protein 27 [Nymphaea thermarum]